MKVRWTQTHLRLRITPEELATLGRRETIEVDLAVGDGGWQLRLEPRGDGLGVAWSAGVMVVHLDEASRRTLLSPESEGAYQQTPRQGPSVSIEKDFPCVHPHPPEAGEPVTDRFSPTESYRARKGLDG